MPLVEVVWWILSSIGDVFGGYIGDILGGSGGIRIPLSLIPEQGGLTVYSPLIEPLTP